MKVVETILDSSGVSGDNNMRISATVFVILILTYLVNASVLDPVIENVVHLKASKPPNSVPGIWKKKTIWKPRWVKEWKSAKVMKPVWRKVWSPVQIREWVPIPKPPPGWDSHSTPLIPIRPKAQKTIKPVKDSIGHGSYAVPSAKIPLWDPVPYPESQQPPPLPYPHADITCGKGGCDNSPSQTFNQQQISEIIGTRYQTPEYHQNPEFSETVNHLTRLPPEGINWKPPQPLPDFRFDNNFPNLPEFLVPPKFQSLPQINPNPTFESVRPWVPLPPENKIKGHFITKAENEPYKAQLPEVETKVKNNTNKEKPQNDKVHSQADRDFIQEAQLVGEYHYSTFDIPYIKPRPTVNVENEKSKHQIPQEPLKPFRPLPKLNEKEIQKPKTNQPFVENKQTSERQKPQILTTPHVQKKHIPNQITTNSNHFPQQKPILREILQKQNPNPDPRSTSKNQLSLNQSTTKLQPIANNSNSTTDTPQNPNLYPIFIPPDHRFSSPSEINQSSNNQTTTESSFKPEKNNTVQIVIATTLDHYNHSTENLQKSTTTEPYEIVFSSSLQATTETVTRSPVIIVTPANSK